MTQDEHLYKLLNDKEYQIQDAKQRCIHTIKYYNSLIEKEMEIQNNLDLSSPEYRESLSNEIKYLQGKQEYFESYQSVLRVLNVENKE